MIKQNLVITFSFFLISLTLSACVTKGRSEGFSVSAINEIKCPQGITVKVDGQSIPVTVPNPFQGFANPALRTQDDLFMVEINIEEVGFFELLDFDVNKLAPGIFEGDQFRLRLSYSSFSREDCTNVNYQRESKLIIEKYSPTGQEFAGCFYGKLDCDGKVIEVKAAVSGVIF
ncbi:hypothetical protein PN36_06480 [Candidatus Thiomargarita nelsonii]|uniref:Lipoprotein n=1 Tax=Candidatus Thiomargarita nelsonii TaxID=1003181 RepID=A0A0A6PAP2_9GAMM|nr:hypothetical protein PN36_06480 [Candidatus Thiomargarita nelsonii]